MPSFILSIDQGTTSTRAIVYDETGQPRGNASCEFPQYYPQTGWVEHDAEEIWKSVADVVPKAIAKANITSNQIRAIGVTNQRETALLWERDSGKLVSPAIVWQDRRTTDFCRDRLADEPWIRARTGLVLDPYFSATKWRWLLDADPQRRRAAEAGNLAAGTIDTFLLWRLTGSKLHATDATNASRTLLLDIHRVTWDEELCRYFDIPMAILPEVRPSAADFSVTRGLDFLPDGIPILGIAGDQQAALLGQGAVHEGDAKCTYGTGAFFLQHTGRKAVHSEHRLLTTLAAMFDQTPEYALEGSAFIAGAAVQWLRDGLKLMNSSSDVEPLAAASDPDQPILFVPGLVGLGAPYWVPEVRGVLFGLTRNTSAADVARAALEGVAYMVTDLIHAAGNETGQPPTALRVDGGMARNDRFLQFQADLLGRPVLRAADGEATALGAAFLAGVQSGIWTRDQIVQIPKIAKSFEPTLSNEQRHRRLNRWRRAVKAVIDFSVERD